MSRVFMTGFEHGSGMLNWGASLRLLEVGTHTSGVTIDNTNVRTGSYCCRIAQGSCHAANATPQSEGVMPAGTEFYARVYVLFLAGETYSVSAAPENNIFSFDGAGAANRRVLISLVSQDATTVTLQAYNNVTGTAVGSTVTMSKGTYHCIELHVVASASAGVIEWRVDEGTVVSITGQNTGAANIDTCSIRWTSASPYLYFDDWAVNDAAGSYCNSWCGPGRIVKQKPNRTLSISIWTVTGAASADVALADGSESTYVTVNNKTQYTYACVGFDSPMYDVPLSSEIKAMAYGLIGGSTASTTRTIMLQFDYGALYNDASIKSGNLGLGYNGWKCIYPALVIDHRQDYMNYFHFAAKDAGDAEYWIVLDTGTVIAQRIVLYETTDLFRVGFAYRSVVNPPDSLTVKLRQGSLTGTVLSSYTWKPEQYAEEKRFQLSGPVTVGAGTYFITLERTGSGTAWEIKGYALSGNAIGKGNLYVNGNRDPNHNMQVDCNGDPLYTNGTRIGSSYGGAQTYGTDMSILDSDTSARLMNVSQLWCNIDYVPGDPFYLAPIPPASLMLMRPRIFPRRKVV